MELVATGALNRQTHEQLAPIISSISSLVYICDTIKKVGYSNSLNDLAAGIIKVTPREVIKEKWSTVQGIFDKNPMSLKDWEELCPLLEDVYKTLKKTKKKRIGFSLFSFFFGSSGQAGGSSQAEKVDAAARSQAKKAHGSSATPLLHVEEVDSRDVSPFKERLTGQSDAANLLSLKQSSQPNLLSGLPKGAGISDVSNLIVSGAMLLLGAQQMGAQENQDFS